ncbi:MAG: glycosyltransferase family 2 protein, partial [Desulfobulbaceae bacterium]|nr:glycosyltransferase family 2 protein [Desulfobulbaceae bacterium]
MQLFLLFIFLATFFLCGATYFLFPLVLLAAGRIFPLNAKKEKIYPSISIIISAYNEENDIAAKIDNTLALNYPPEKVEILIGSDGSTDNTASIVESFTGERIRFYDFQKNRGKTSVQNDLVEKSKGDILVFTDAASFLSRDSVEKLVRNFADSRVGCVAGRLRFIDTDQNLTTESQGLYWRYEVKLRELESCLGTLVGVDGPLYAVRKKCYVPLEANIISDLMTPLLVLEQGRKVILEPEAVVDEKPTQKGSD